VGCGAGEILTQLADALNQVESFTGYEISPQAFVLCQQRANDRVRFRFGDAFQDKEVFDLLLAIDVVEHVEDYFAFLRRLKTKAAYKLFHVPLDLSVQTVLRGSPLLHVREKVGHIHYFTREIFNSALVETGYDIVHQFYTSTALDLPVRSSIAKAARLPRRIIGAISPGYAARILGGYSLLVLAK
jgi:cyclopropane fatty-acyl-phospholipid synthase-like methyltransferase